MFRSIRHVCRSTWPQGRSRTTPSPPTESDFLCLPPSKMSSSNQLQVHQLELIYFTTSSKYKSFEVVFYPAVTAVPSSFCSSHSLCRPYCQVRAVSRTCSYPYWHTSGSGWSVTQDTARSSSACPFLPGSERGIQATSAECLERHVFGECLVNWDSYRLCLAWRKEEGKTLHVGRAKVCKRAIHPCCSNYQRDHSGSLEHLCCGRHIKSMAYTTRKTMNVRDPRGLLF